MLVNGREISVGADPEFFLSDGEKVVSAFGLFKGTKRKPQPVNLGAVQVDGMAAEINIQPAMSKQEFLHHLFSVKQQLSDMVGLGFYDKCVAEFEEEWLKLQPEEATNLGCDPDYTAYGMTINDRPNAALPIRTAGGHIHIGGYPTHDEQEGCHMMEMARLTRLMDKHVGIYSLLWDKEDRRREMYGLPGAFRPKKFGVEYRTLSNAWANKPELCELVYDQTIKAVEEYEEGGEGSMEVHDIILSSDREALSGYDKGVVSRINNIMGEA